jgi:CubicO group peptidase (beta-lactamase class C family)
MNMLTVQNKTWWRFAVLSLCFLAMLSVSFPLSAQTADGDAETLEKIDGLLAGLADNRDFSGAVLIARGDEVLFKKGYGYAVTEWEVPNTPDTVFRIGSITKQFTAMAILKLQEAGLLDLDDLICPYLKKCPDTWSKITIYHLLTHTSGIPSYTGTSLKQLMLSDVSSDKVVDTFINLPLQFEPGSDWSYSNSGYHVLGDIIAKVAGTTYGRYLRDTFFEPLGLDDTRLEVNFGVIPRRAEGYVNENVRADYINMNVPYSAGALISSVEDLYLWERALYTGQIVSQETLDAMWQRAYPIDDATRYGYGLVRQTMQGQDVISHGGSINGFASQMDYLPEHDLTFVVLTNRENETANEAMSVLFDLMVAETSSPPS